MSADLGSERVLRLRDERMVGEQLRHLGPCTRAEFMDSLCKDEAFDVVQVRHVQLGRRRGFARARRRGHLAGGEQRHSGGETKG